MSLLEDIFLQDEADEAQELERVIEGDEFDERPRSRSNSPESDESGNRDDEAEEDKRRVDPSSTKAKRVIKNPRFILNPARLTGPRGIQIIPDHFKDFKFKGKGHEKDDLDMVLKKLEHWAYRLYPKFQFEDCLKKIETLGKKRPVMVHLHKIRTDQFLSEDTVVQKESSDEETPAAPQEEDEFDKLLQQQIDIARATPAPGSVKKVVNTPKQDRSPFTMPKATSSPSISDEQKERMLRNRKLAEERRLARLKQNSIDTSTKQDSSNISDTIEIGVETTETNVPAKKHNRSNVIDSSDDECDVTSVNQAITVDVHNSKNIDEDVNDKSTNNGKVVLETGENNLDIEMDQSDTKNNAVEVVQDVVEIIDVVDKVIDRNVSTSNAIECETNVIEIIDHIDRSIHKNIESDKDVIEITDDGIIKNSNIESEIDKDDEMNEHADKVEVVEINDNFKVVEENCRIRNETDVMRENEGNLTVDLTTAGREQTPDAGSINVDDTNSTEKQSKSPMNHDSIHKNTENELHKKSEDTVDNDPEFNQNNDSSNSEQKNSGIAEVTEDIMDVDFSDDF